MPHARLFVSTVLLICAVATLALPLLLLAIPTLSELPMVDGIAFVSLLGLFPLFAVAAIIAGIVIIVRRRVWQPVIEISIACILLIVAALNGSP